MKPYVILLISLLVVSGVLIFTPFEKGFLVKEGGVIEVSTVVLYGVLIGLLLVLRNLRWLWGNILCSLCVLVLLFRELDFDKAFTTMGIFKSNFYKSDSISLLEKSSGLFVTLLILAIFSFTFRHYRKSLWLGIRQLKKPELGVAFAIALAMVSKLILDGLPRKLDNIGLTLSEFLQENHGILEEVLELGIPLSLLFSLHYLRLQGSEK